MNSSFRGKSSKERKDFKNVKEKLKLITTKRIRNNGEDTTTYGQEWDIKSFGPGAQQNMMRG